MFPSFFMRNGIVVIRTLWNSCKGDSGDTVYSCVSAKGGKLCYQVSLFRFPPMCFARPEHFFCIIVPHVTNNDVTAYI
jgi:hypothetical protein